MKRSSDSLRLIAGILVALAAIAGSARADLATCQAALAKNASKLSSKMEAAFLKCANAIRKDEGRGLHLSKAADVCEKALLKVYNVGGEAGAGMVNKFLAALTKQHPRKCTEADLMALGHMVSGLNAPGLRGPNCISDIVTPCSRDSDCSDGFCPGAMNFVASLLVLTLDDQARNAVTAAVPDITNLVTAVVELDPGQLPALNSNEFGTNDCSRSLALPPESADHKKRPNVCLLRRNPFIFNVTKTCTMTAASSLLWQPFGAPLSLSGRTLQIDINQFVFSPITSLPNTTPFDWTTGHCECNGSFTCTQNAACTESGGECGVSPAECVRGFIPLVKTSPQNLVPPPVIPAANSTYVCLSVLSHEGWCDCGSTDASFPGPGYGIPFEPFSCVDHDASTPGGANDDCGQPVANAQLEDCVCAAPAAPSCSSAGCLACVDPDLGVACHSGTSNGPLSQVWSGASTAGSCALLAQVQFKFVPFFMCVDSGNTALGPLDCVAAGAPPPGCSGAGGTQCISLNCNTSLVPTSPQTSIPLTTGTATGHISDFPVVQGACAGGTTPGMNCARNADCGGGGTCTGAVLGCGTGPNGGDCQFSNGPGTGIPCQQIEDVWNSLPGFKLVGVLPRLHQPVFGNTLMEVTFECQ